MRDNFINYFGGILLHFILLGKSDFIPNPLLRGIYTRAILKITSGELFTKQAMR
jgi:hypothetical protein